MIPPTRFIRGNALPETAISACVVLMILFGAIRLATIGYMQAEADGATFVAAHIYARSPTTTVQDSQNGAAHIFTNVPAAGITVGYSGSGTAATDQTYADYESTTAGISLFPGTTPNIKIRSHFVEPYLPQIVPGTYSGAINIGASDMTLSNMVNGSCSPFLGSTGPTYQIYIAQYVETSASSWGHYAGRYNEWECHYAGYVYDYNDLPNTYPTSFNWASYPNLEADEQNIYSWDSTSPGSSDSCIW